MSIHPAIPNTWHEACWVAQAEATQAQAAALAERDREAANSMRLLENGHRQQLEVILVMC